MAALYSYAPFLTCVQDALKQLAQEPPTGVFDSGDEHAKLMGAFANQIGIMLAESEDWQQLINEWVLVGDSVRTNFDLPADVSRLVADSGWSYALRRPVIIINAQQRAEVNAWMSGTFLLNPACRLMNDQLVFQSPPAVGEEIKFEYLSKNWVLDGNAVTRKPLLTANADTPLFDSILFTNLLKLKWLQTRGMPTSAVQDDFNRRYLQVTARDNLAQTMTLNGGIGSGMRYMDGYNIPDTNLGL